MIEFHNAPERRDWYKVVKAVLKGGATTDVKAAVKIADYVVEQDRTRRSKSIK